MNITSLNPNEIACISGGARKSARRKNTNTTISLQDKILKFGSKNKISVLIGSFALSIIISGIATYIDSKCKQAAESYAMLSTHANPVPAPSMGGNLLTAVVEMLPHFLVPIATFNFFVNR